MPWPSVKVSRLPSGSNRILWSYSPPSGYHAGSGVAFLARFLLSTVLVAAGHGEPGTVGGGLARLGVEPGGKGIRAGKRGAVDWQVVIATAAPIHPAPQALVPDELDGAQGLVYGRLL